MTKQQRQATTKAPKVNTLELTEDELDKVIGGKVSVHDLNITKHVDKASPVLMLAT